MRNIISQQITNKPNSFPVYASIYPLGFFAQEIGGDRVSVISIVPPGVEPHEYEPNPRKLASIYNGKVLIINGAGIEPWAEKIKSDLFTNDIILITASDGMGLFNKDGRIDPHVWLDPVLAQRMVLNIRDGLIKADPLRESLYRSNADNLIARLIELDGQFKKSLSSCKQDTVVVSHNVFGYLGRRYKFQQISLSGLSPDEEPAPNKMADIVNEIKNRGIKVILTETLVSPKTANTLAKEAGVTTLVFNPLEGIKKEDYAKGKDYFSIQNDNLKTLVTSLQCPEL